MACDISVCMKYIFSLMDVVISVLIAECDPK